MIQYGGSDTRNQTTRFWATNAQGHPEYGHSSMRYSAQRALAATIVEKTSRYRGAVWGTWLIEKQSRVWYTKIHGITLHKA
jgi:hypothetical protein